MKIVELNFSCLDLEEFELLTHSLLNTALSCGDASIRTKIYHLFLRVISASNFESVD